MHQTDIDHYVRAYHNNLSPDNRYASFDYCYNYFYTTLDLTKDMEKSCLTLGFFLASWGMFRSQFLLQRSINHYRKTIEFIASLDRVFWETDVKEYDVVPEVILALYDDFKRLMLPEGKRDLTLVTKILLGVFGMVPAFDTYFCETFKKIYPHCSFGSLNEESLSCIKHFYNNNQQEIDRLSDQICTIDFLTGEETNIHYKKAKIIDMYGWQKAFQKEAAITSADNGMTISRLTQHKSNSLPQSISVGSKMTKKSVIIEMISTPMGASIDEMADAIIKRGIDDDLEKTKRVVKTWLYKIGFNVERSGGNRYRKA